MSLAPPVNLTPRHVLFLLWVLTSLAGAEAGPGPTVTMRVEPPDTRVSDQFGELGLANRPLRLRRLDVYNGGSIELSFQAAGYQTVTQSVSAAYFNSHESYPADGTLRLQPDSPAAYLAYYRVPLILGGVPLLVGVVLLWRSRRKDPWTEKLKAHLASADPRAPAGQLGPYVVMERLGGGGMATVYRGLSATDPGSRPVALKVLDPTDGVADQEFLSRFQREVNLYRELDHPNIVKMYDYGEHDGSIYLVLELIEGGTLRSRVRPGGLSPEETLQVLEPLFEAVQYAHGLGVVHRDLKPENIMLTTTGTVKVADFGLGKALDSKSLTRTGTALGTPAYMAPEQIKGVLFEPASDQYALGVIAYELLCGRRPFEAEDPLQIVFAKMSEPTPLCSCFRSDVPEGVDAALARMLRSEPGERFGNVTEAGAVLFQALRGWNR
ncbi:MAG: serine/threonine-protein kinase [Candidatus Eremiobacterota bacterium]